MNSKPDGLEFISALTSSLLASSYAELEPNRVVCEAAANLHPEEESFGAGFKLQHVDTARGALVDPLELAVIGEDDQVLNGDVHSF